MSKSTKILWCSLFLLLLIEVCCVKILIKWATILAVLFFMSYQGNITQVLYVFGKKIGPPYCGMEDALTYIQDTWRVGGADLDTLLTGGRAWGMTLSLFLVTKAHLGCHTLIAWWTGNYPTQSADPIPPHTEKKISKMKSQTENISVLLIYSKIKEQVFGN